jgi:hypothetical protein
MIRFLNSETCRLDDDASDAAPYAILSHRWGTSADEVSYQDIRSDSEDFEAKPGYSKLAKFCEKARQFGLAYAWADTCCIDKTDYVEHSTALTKMFTWYRDAQLCCVYLNDVHHRDNVQEFLNSSWFKRGWTLQELVAPLQVVFFDKSWNEIGTKASLADEISSITGISQAVLVVNHPGDVSVAQRMSWAANRETRYPEDRAYSLMGLFGVSMPVLYGEGDRAFERLQTEIMRTSDDESLFAWSRHWDDGRGGLLATSPDDFDDCDNVFRLPRLDGRILPYGMTNRGLRISLPLVPGPDEGTFMARLRCSRYGSPLQIKLRRHSDNTYSRVKLDLVDEGQESDDGLQSTEIYVRETVASQFEVGDWMRAENSYTFVIRQNTSGARRDLSKTNGCFRWDMSESVLLFSHSSHAGVFVFENETGTSLAVCVGVHNYNVWCAMEGGTAGQRVDPGRFRLDGPDAETRWSSLDRKTLLLGHGEDSDKVSVALTKGARWTHGEWQKVWYVDITFTTRHVYSLTDCTTGCCRPD